MSPTNNVGMELPPPVSEQLPPSDLPAKPEVGPEMQAVSPLETAPASRANQPLVGTPPPINLPVNGLPKPLPIPSSLKDDSQSSSLMADDGDLIEKEWVNKAKSIVERTKEDPYKQSEELMLLKADYLQKRYSKTLKQST